MNDYGLQLPPLLRLSDGQAVDSAAAWGQRRGEILELFREHVYGRRPGRPEAMEFRVDAVDPEAMGGGATCKQVSILFEGPGGSGRIGLVLFVPNRRPGPAPGFVLITHSRRSADITAAREVRSGFWPAEQIVSRGYATAAFHVADVAPDDPECFAGGALRVFGPADGPRAPDAWGAIAAWGWAASRALDYLQTDADVDASRMAVIGHSRGGKAALWAGAEDERFALAISNNSGCTGAALARHAGGETVRQINDRFPHWFCDNYKRYNDRERELPVDQHMLLALLAPRLVYVASATEDAWADPAGEFAAAGAASEAWSLLGRPGLAAAVMPPAETPVQEGRIGYHLRTGGHGLTEYDWQRYMDFADRHVK